MRVRVRRVFRWPLNGQILALGVLAVSVVVDHDGAWLFRLGLLLATVMLIVRPAAAVIERARQDGYDAGYDDGRTTQDSDSGGVTLAFRRPAKQLG